jgi:hypothetical protein
MIDSAGALDRLDIHELDKKVRWSRLVRRIQVAIAALVGRGDKILAKDLITAAFDHLAPLRAVHLPGGLRYDLDIRRPVIWALSSEIRVEHRADLR